MVLSIQPFHYYPLLLVSSVGRLRGRIITSCCNLSPSTAVVYISTDLNCNAISQY